ncbi:O-antigen ligase family protein [Microcoleus sp. PH2017_28_MFU_U_A]|uniref:O-antigen ligase family protein n=1 Tax=Microcoleus sp. PH2017_28_MFU_U_A TaxID=2798838 RepID=UPI001DD117A8|nr:O-antigen ligase family protein [Microcoleus sp. PH2017_28_MFU_U_A]MCC3592289.1 O-antigen ligase family protein [Microcoleus sp. PH2017_28_MFU_U_A]
MNIKKTWKLAVKQTAKNLNSYLQKHPDRRLQIPWNLAQIGMLIFPTIPILGALGIFLGLAGTCQQKFRQICRSPLNRGFAILSVLLVITTIFANNRIEAVLGLCNFWPFFILFAVFSSLIQTPAQLRQLSWIIAISAIPVIILGLGQQFLGWSGIDQLQPIFGWVLEPKGNPPGRMASVFMYANILAGYLTIAFILTLGLWMEERGRKKEEGRGKKGEGERGRGGEGETGRGGELPNYQLPMPNAQSPMPNAQCPMPNAQCPMPNTQFIFLSFAVVGNAVALIFTNSRNAWGLAVLAVLAFAFYAGYKKILAAVFSAVGAVFLSAFGPEPLRQYLRIIIPAFFWARLTDEMFPNRPTATLRTTQWEFAWSMAQQRPWTGWGLRNFTPLYQDRMHEWLGHPHSLMLMLAAETGFPTTLLLFGLVGWVLARGVLLLANWQVSAVDIKQEQIATLEVPENNLVLNQNSISSSTNQVVCQDVENADRLIFFSYLLAFAACTLFNTVDVTLFDLRVNTISWVLLAAICGIGNRESGIGNRE